MSDNRVWKRTILSGTSFFTKAIVRLCEAGRWRPSSRAHSELLSSPNDRLGAGHALARHLQCTMPSLPMLYSPSQSKHRESDMIRVLVIVPIILSFLLGGCKKKLLPVVPIGHPLVSCIELEDAPHSKLMVDTEKKTLFLIESSKPHIVKYGENKEVIEYQHDLIAFDIVKKTTTRILENIQTNILRSKKGHLIFSRPNEMARKGSISTRFSGQNIYVLDPGSREPRLLLESNSINEFFLNGETDAVFLKSYVNGKFAFYRVPLMGGLPEQLVTPVDVATWDLHGVVGGTLLMSPIPSPMPTRPNKSWTIVPFGEDKGNKIEMPGLFVGTFNEHLFYTPENETEIRSMPIGKTSQLPSNDEQPSEANSGVHFPIKFDQADFGMQQTASAFYFFGSQESQRAIYSTNGQVITRLLRYHGGSVESVASLGPDQLAILLTQDTNNDGVFGQTDETDLCFVDQIRSPEPAQFPVRSSPRRFVKTMARLSSLRDEADLQGAKLQIYDTQENGRPILLIRTPQSGPAGVVDLYARMRALQKQVDALNGAENNGAGNLDLSISYLGDRRRRGRSTWSNKFNRYTVYAGIGAALLEDTDSLDLEVQPRVRVLLDSLYRDGDPKIGPVTCHGTIRNLSKRVLRDLEVLCVMKTGWLDDVEKRMSITSVLLPNKSVNYSLPLGIGTNDNVQLHIYEAGREIDYLNNHNEQKMRALLDVAERVYEHTGLAYAIHAESVEGPSYDRRKKVRITVVAPEKFLQKERHQQDLMAASALSLFSSYWKQESPNAQFQLDMVDDSSEVIRHY